MSDHETDLMADRLLGRLGRRPASRRWFDPQLNFGHVAALLGVLSAGVVFWNSVQLWHADHERRIVTLEAMRTENQAALEKLNTTCNELLRANTRIETKLEYLSGKQN